jgi:phytoene dehydrogenase-like protein
MDAAVIGAGPNGLVAAIMLADAGWDVTVFEAQDTPGGAVRSAEVTAPGYVSDLFSSFYPLGLGSPVLRGLDLAAHGLRWAHAPTVLAHPFPDGRTAVLHRDLAATAASVDAFAPGDGAAWEALYERWRRVSPALIDALFTPFPPVRAGLRLGRALGLRDGLRFARFGVLPVRRFAEEEVGGAGAALLLAGNALHTDLGPDSAGGAIFGWLLAMLGQQVGFPVPVGGAGALTDALVSRLRAAGGRVETGAAVTRVLVRAGRAVGIAVGEREVRVRRAVLADVAAPTLYLDLVGADLLPTALKSDVDRFHWDNGTVKVDWALSGKIPWRQDGPAGAGTVHIGGELDDLARFTHQLAVGQLPADPFVLCGQMSTADPSRSPAGTESAWGYTHVPVSPRGDAAGELRGDWTDAAQRDAFVARLERQVEAYAPGFGDLVVGRHVQFPGDLAGADANLVGGALNGGTAAVHQQLIFRPVPGLGRAETPFAGLYLASSSAHPGGGVHGACGANAARAALRATTTGRLALAATRAISGRPG